MSDTNHTPEPCGYCKQVDRHSRGCCLSPDICDRLIDRQNHGRDDLSNGVLHDLGLMREAVAEIERLRRVEVAARSFHAEFCKAAKHLTLFPDWLAEADRALAAALKEPTNG